MLRLVTNGVAQEPWGVSDIRGSFVTVFEAERADFGRNVTFHIHLVTKLSRRYARNAMMTPA